MHGTNFKCSHEKNCNKYIIKELHQVVMNLLCKSMNKMNEFSMTPCSTHFYLRRGPTHSDRTRKGYGYWNVELNNTKNIYNEQQFHNTPEQMSVIGHRHLHQITNMKHFLSITITV